MTRQLPPVQTIFAARSCCRAQASVQNKTVRTGSTAYTRSCWRDQQAELRVDQGSKGSKQSLIDVAAYNTLPGASSPRAGADGDDIFLCRSACYAGPHCLHSAVLLPQDNTHIEAAEQGSNRVPQLPIPGTCRILELPVWSDSQAKHTAWAHKGTMAQMIFANSLQLHSKCYQYATLNAFLYLPSAIATQQCSVTYYNDRVPMVHAHADVTPPSTVNLRVLPGQCASGQMLRQDAIPMRNQPRTCQGCLTVTEPFL